MVRPKILVVDDDANNHRVFERTLESLQLEFVRAMSGQQALAVAHKHDFFLILMDVQMPGMDGFETASLILQHPKTSHIPVMFVTAFARDETFETKGYFSGAVDYLVKPINENIVRSKVKVFLDLYQDRQELNRVYKLSEQNAEALRIHKENLEDEVERRTFELRKSIENLTNTQAQLIETEKMASLGRLVAGISHELNTPIGVCVTGASYLHEQINMLITALGQGKIRKKDLDHFIEAGSKSIDVILFNLARASTLISNFKLVSVDVSSEIARPFNLLEYIGNISQSLDPELKNGQHQVSVTGDKNLIVEICPGTLTQIITNLVMNSIIHGFTDKTQGKLVIDVVRDEDEVKLSYSDNGCGMSTENMPMIFEPFYTTRRGSGGSGLGMNIVYNLVTNTLNGDVECISEVGQGMTVNINFPIKQIAQEI